MVDTFSSKMLGDPCPTSGGNMLRMAGDRSLPVEETLTLSMAGDPCPTSGGNMLRMAGDPCPSNGGYIFFENAR